MRTTRLLLGLAASALVCALAPGAATAATYHYVDWTAASAAAGSASGTISLPDGSTVAVAFQSYRSDGTPGTLRSAQTSGGTNFWNPSTPYISAEVENAPPNSDIVTLVGGTNQTYVVTLSEEIKDPIMAILSLGQPSVFTSYDFDSPFTIVSQGTGFWGGTSTSLQQQAGDLLVGNEGHGTLQFIGTFSTFSWTVPTPENWHGFTFGIRTTEAIEPTVPEPASLVALGAAAVALHVGRGRGARRA